MAISSAYKASWGQEGVGYQVKCTQSVVAPKRVECNVTVMCNRCIRGWSDEDTMNVMLGIQRI